ncbi:unnamed protein product [Prorocentrum cordatum]|uniref:Bile salt export pump n=1 Tax=Prorocentrum cordatum TaxID=2364126 RepID=A0ABN9V9G8_9DINO|nr:unnamed protein product [Polarella glacialis]
MLGAKGHRPARKVLGVLVDEFEDALVTEEPLAVPARSAHVAEMAELLGRSLRLELQAAMHRGDVGEVQELQLLAQRARRRVDPALCAEEVREAARFVEARGATRRQQIWRLARLCDREAVVWLALGLFIKVVSQIPGPLRMLYVSSTVMAASKGVAGLDEFHQAAVTSFWLFAAEKLLQFAGRITMFRGEQLFTVRLKREVYAACLRQDMEFFDTQRCGELQTRLNKDTQEVCQKLLYFPVRFVQFTFFLIFNLLTLLSANPRLVLATLSVLPVSLFGNLILMKRLQRFYQKLRRRAEESASSTQEVLNSIRTVRSFAREFRELQRYTRDQEYEARVLSEVNLLQSMTQPLLHAISEMSFFVGLYYGGLLITQGLLSAGEVITLVQGTQACTSVLTDLFDTLPEIAAAGPPAARICDLLERPSSIEPGLIVGREMEAGHPALASGAGVPRATGGAGAVCSLEGGVEFEDVHFSYSSRRDLQVLRGLSFVAHAGEVVGLVGATGCGKSTITYLLLRFYSPAKGRISLDGRPVEEYDVHWLRQQIGVVAQDSLLFGTSIRQNLLYGVELCDNVGVDDQQLQGVLEQANAWDFIRRMPEGLSTEVGERGVQLSGGQKQRIAIARAVLKRPKVLLLDEATSALDMESEKVVQQALEEVIRASCCTTIMIAHRLATVQSATKIMVLAEGAIREEGPPRELAKRPGGLYARMLQAAAGEQGPPHAPASAGSVPPNGTNGAHPPDDAPDADGRPAAAEGLRLRAGGPRRTAAVG